MRLELHAYRVLDSRFRIVSIMHLQHSFLSSARSMAKVYRKPAARAVIKRPSAKVRKQASRSKHGQVHRCSRCKAVGHRAVRSVC